MPYDPTTGRPTIDLNADLGEGCPWDAALLDLVTSASICCGAHAGDPEAIRSTLRDAQQRGVVVGAHPGYADRPGFGRRERASTAREVEDLIRSQVAELQSWAAELGMGVRFLKPHGALYNQAQVEEPIARGVVGAALALNLPVLGQPRGQVEATCSAAGCPFLAEGFADRAYGPDGRLVPRSQPGAILEDPDQVEAQVLRLIGEGIRTLCLHGDNPRSVRLAITVRDILDRHGIALRAFVAGST